MYDLETHVRFIKGVGPKGATTLKKLGITTVGDLFWHIPSGYQDFRKVVTVAKAPLDTALSIKGEISNITSRRSFKNRKLVLTEALLSDDSGSLPLVWFSRFPLKIPEGEALVSGTVEYTRGRRQISSPIVERPTRARVGGHLVPLYSLTAGITQDRLRTLLHDAVAETVIDDPLPQNVLRANSLLSLASAFQKIHIPEDETDVGIAKKRLAFDELFFLELSRGLSRQARAARQAPKIRPEFDGLVSALPFSLTADQELALREILADFSSGKPMARLLEGEVGSGKTVVAALASAAMAKAGYQTFYLVPTDVLAKQQFDSLGKFLSPLGVTVGILTRTQAASTHVENETKKSVVNAVKEGKIMVLIGTQALLQESVEAHQLGFVVVDEQHRFGVEQRFAAQKTADKKQAARIVPHVLSMSATPIPRTLQLVFLSDLDVSLLKTPPKGKRKVKTMLFKPSDRRRVEVAVMRRIQKGEQVYVVCPLIDPSDTLGVKSATAEFERLQKGPFQKSRIGLLHGKLSSKEKNAVLESFRQHELDMLVSTTVIEVGVDIPNATVIVIEAAERFGLAQLHQLRGRVGRAGQEGVCVLFTENASERAQHRLEQFVDTDDGFKLAELDLRLRGPGEWFGLAQSGFEEFKLADVSDEKLLHRVQNSVDELLRDDPKLNKHQDLRYFVETLLARQHHVS